MHSVATSRSIALVLLLDIIMLGLASAASSAQSCRFPLEHSLLPTLCNQAGQLRAGNSRTVQHDCEPLVHSQTGSEVLSSSSRQMSSVQCVAAASPSSDTVNLRSGRESGGDSQSENSQRRIKTARDGTFCPKTASDLPERHSDSRDSEPVEISCKGPAPAPNSILSDLVSRVELLEIKSNHQEIALNQIKDECNKLQSRVSQLESESFVLCRDAALIQFEQIVLRFLGRQDQNITCPMTDIQTMLNHTDHDTSKHAGIVDNVIETRTDVSHPTVNSADLFVDVLINNLESNQGELSSADEVSKTVAFELSAT